jgi:hypothetical protein
MRASPAARLAGLVTTMILAAASGACSATPDLTFGDDVAIDAGPGDAHVPAFGGQGAYDAALSPFDAGLSPPASDATPPPSVSDAALPPGTTDAGPTLPPDAGPTAPVDAGPVLSCPHAPPAGADLCCGAIPCVGKKCAAVCNECAACAGSVCCAAANGKSASCASSTSACPKNKPGNAARADESAEATP